MVEAVLKEDVARVRSLLGVGADVDEQVRGVRGLDITSIRDLARVLQYESILKVFDAEVSLNMSSF